MSLTLNRYFPNNKFPECVESYCIDCRKTSIFTSYINQSIDFHCTQNQLTGFCIIKTVFYTLYYFIVSFEPIIVN